jgi:hypothetical protein
VPDVWTLGEAVHRERQATVQAGCVAHLRFSSVSGSKRTEVKRE